MRTSGPETKLRIERAAIRVFVRAGVAGASIRDIAREAKVSLGALYNHYQSKDELAWTLFARGWSDMASDLRSIMKQKPTLATQLPAMIGYVFEAFEKDWEQVGYVYLSRHENIRRVTGRLPNPHLVFRLAIIEAMRRKEIDAEDPDLLTAMIMGVMIQAIDIKILGRLKPPLTQCTDRVAKACARMLGV